MPQYLMVNLKYKFEAKIRNDYVEYTHKYDIAFKIRVSIKAFELRCWVLI